MARLVRVALLLGLGVILGVFGLTSHWFTAGQLLGTVLWGVVATWCVRTLIRLLRS